jgi:ferredoxin-NADP reductase/ferredoxin
MMALIDYWPLVRDAGTIARTIARVRTGIGRGAPVRHDSGGVRAVVDRIHPPRLDVRVTEERWESRAVKTLALVRLAGALPPFVPGQHVSVFLTVNGAPEMCSVPITSPVRRRDVLEVSIAKQRFDVPTMALIDEVRHGDRLVISGPEGAPCSHPARDADDLVFITLGEGIIGFISMIEHVLDTRPKTRIAVLHGARSARDLPFRERLRALTGRHPERLSVKLFLARPAPDWTGERGPLTDDAVRRFVGAAASEQRTFFLGGSADTRERIRDVLCSAGVRRGNIRSAAPLGLGDVSLLPGWPAGIDRQRVFTISIPGHNRTVRALAGQPLLRALERVTGATRASCGAGVCGACRVRLTKGRVFTAPGANQRPGDDAAGYVLPCRSYPISDLTVTGV